MSIQSKFYDKRGFLFSPRVLYEEILKLPSSKQEKYAKWVFDEWLSGGSNEKPAKIPLYLFRFIPSSEWKEFFFKGLRMVLDPLETCHCDIFEEDWESEDEDSDYGVFMGNHCPICIEGRNQYRKLRLSEEAKLMLEDLWNKWVSQTKLLIPMMMSMDRLGLVPDLANEVLESLNNFHPSEKELKKVRR